MDQDWLHQLLPYISPYNRELVVNIVDSSLIVDEDLLDKVWKMAIVAKSCLDPDPSKRPLMRNVLEALQNPLEVAKEAEPCTALRELDDRPLSLRYLMRLPFPKITIILFYLLHKIN